MIRTGLTYHAPDDAEQACLLLSELGDEAVVLGGGTVLLPAMGRGERTHGHVVDLRRLGLSGVTVTDEYVDIGAMATYSTVLAADTDGPAALLKLAAGGVTGGPQLRNQGTIGGSASYANPASDVPGVLVAMEAQLLLQGSDGVREVAAEDFFKGAFVTALEADEILTTIRVPRKACQVGYYKLKLSESSWPIATAAARVELVDGRLAAASVTLGAVCPTPVTVDVTACLDESGEVRVSDDEWAELVDGHLENPWHDELAPATYRRQVAGVVAHRALQHTSRGGER